MANKKLLLSFSLILLVLSSCGTSKIPVKTVTVEKEVVKYIQKDTTIYVTIPIEIVKEVVPQVDTSRIETSIAKSVAYLDTLNKTIIHTIENKTNSIKTEIKWLEKEVEKEVIVERDVPIEIVKVKVAWWCWLVLMVSPLIIGSLLVLLIKK